MLKTNTEDFNTKLNYYSTGKNIEGADKNYVSALKNIINIFGNQVSNGLKTQEEINDFGDMLSIVQYLDNKIEGVNELGDYYSAIITNSKEFYNEKINSQKVA